MKIAIVLSKTPAYSETFFVSKIRGLKNSGFHVVLFVQEKNIEFNLCKVYVAPRIYKNIVLQVIQTFIGFMNLVPVAMRAWKFLKLENESGRSFKKSIKNLLSNSHLIKAEVDWLHFGYATNALNKENIAKSIDAKLSVSLRGFDICIYPLKHQNCYDLLWRRIDKLHVISDDLRSLAYKNGLSKDTPVVKITPAINICNFQLKGKALDKKMINFTSVARLHWKKGLIGTLEALKFLKLSDVDFNYYIIGNGPQFEELKFAIFQLGLQDNVVLLGKKTQSEIIDQLINTDIYLQYSLSEGFCNALLEAQAIECLVIGSDAEGIPENISDGKSGFIVPRNKPKLLFAKIIEVMEMDNEKLRLIKTYARQRVFSEFNVNHQATQFASFYNQKDII